MSEHSRVRVSIVGVVIVALFSTLLARLWFLQAGPEDSLKVQAVAESTHTLKIPMPRGEITDRKGVVLVKDRASWAVTIDRNLSKSTLDRVIGQLAERLGLSVGQLQSQYDSQRQSPLEPAVVALDVSQPNRLAILQDPQDYPGVHVVELTVREYPGGDLAAQVLGYVGEIPAEQLAKLENGVYEPGDQIGRAGAEAAFESALRGTPRRETIAVDPTGRQVGAPFDVHRGEVGDTVVLTLDDKVQRAAETSLAQGIVAARTLQNDNVTGHFENLKAPAGAVVVLDARDGSVVAMASYPTYPPSDWVGGISAANYANLQNPARNYPLINRATQGLYAPGSTFKLVSALAMANDGIRGPNDYYTDTGSVRIGNTTFSNAKNEQFGPVNLQQALTVSSDVYFYTVGNDFWRVWKQGDVRGLGIQQEARDLGFGQKTGFDLDEASGRVPDPAWKQAFANANYKTKLAKQQNGTWYPGDNLTLAVGQGDLVVTPLQLANAYAAFANGGTLWRPHLEQAVVNSRTNRASPVHPTAIRHVAIDPGLRATMLAGFVGAVQNSTGTAYQAFQGFPFTHVSVAGKTGTAQVQGKGDTSLFAAMFPADNPTYVVLAVVEQAGFGVQTAAPIVRRVIESMNGLPTAPVQVIKQGHD